MLKLIRPSEHAPTLDLATVHATLAYMHHDLGRLAGLDRAAAAIAEAMREIEAAEGSARAPTESSLGRSRLFARGR